MGPLEMVTLLGSRQSGVVPQSGEAGTLPNWALRRVRRRWM